MPAWTKSLLLSLAVLTLSLAALYNAFKTPQTVEVKNKKTTALAVRAHEVSVIGRRPLLFLIGKVEAPDYAVLTAPVEAAVLKLPLVEGDYFPAGRQLLRFDLREQQQAIKQQEAASKEIRLNIVAIARNRAADNRRLQDMRRLTELAEKNYKRSESLLAADVVTRAAVERDEQIFRAKRQELESLQNRVADYLTQKKSLEARLQGTEAKVEQTRLLIERAKMLAPFAGRVAKVHAARGQRATPGEKLMEIYDPAYLRLRTSLPQRFAALANKDMHALLNVDTAVTAAFSGMEPRVAAGNSGLDVFFRLPKGNWVLGATHKVEVLLPEREDLIAVPASAIYGDNRVYRINKDNRVESHSCTRFGLGRLNGQAAELLRCPNLIDGDIIVANQLPILVDTSPVRIVP